MCFLNPLHWISACGDFTSGPSAWPYVLTATLLQMERLSQSAQTFTMNVTSLPADGANVRVYKTTANGSAFFASPVALTLVQIVSQWHLFHLTEQLNSNSLVEMWYLML